MIVTEEMEQDREIRGQSGEQDRFAQVQLQNRLRCQFGFSAQAISAQCSQGILLLEGNVDCFHKKQIAQELARRVSGVRLVVNRLVVDPSCVRDRVTETFCTSSEYLWHRMKETASVPQGGDLFSEQRVVVPTDFSEATSAAVATALELVDHRDGAHVISVVPLVGRSHS